MPSRKTDDSRQGRARPPDAPPGGGEQTRRHANGLRRVRRPRPTGTTAGFTLAEVLAALLFMAIVVPVAMSAYQVASLSGEVAERKAVAARVADRVLNEAVVTASSTAFAEKGIVMENSHAFRWTLHREDWPISVTSTSALQVLTAAVWFSAQGHDYDVQLSTLVNRP